MKSPRGILWKGVLEPLTHVCTDLKSSKESNKLKIIIIIIIIIIMMMIMIIIICAVNYVVFVCLKKAPKEKAGGPSSVEEKKG